MYEPSGYTAVPASAPNYKDPATESMMDQPPPYPAVPASANYNNAPQTQQTSIMIMPRILYGPQSMRVTCVCCHQQVQTTTVDVNGAATWAAVAVICFLCFCFAWIPLCMDSLKDIQHYCPSCNALLGVYQKLKT